MRYEIRRCEHCGKLYYYQSSGEGCHDRLNNSLYCRECQAAVRDALDGIPVKIDARFVEIEINPELIAKFDETRRIYEAHSAEFSAFSVRTVVWDGKLAGIPCDVIDKFYFDGREYAYGKDDEGNEHAYLLYEYDLIEDRFGDVYDTLEPVGYVSYTQITNGCHHQRKFKIEDVPVCPMSPPVGKLFYIDFPYMCSSYLNESEKRVGNNAKQYENAGTKAWENLIEAKNDDAAKLSWMGSFSKK